MPISQIYNWSAKALHDTELSYVFFHYVTLYVFEEHVDIFLNCLNKLIIVKISGSNICLCTAH